VAIEERFKRLDGLRQKMPRSIEIYKAQAGETASPQVLVEKQTLFDRWPLVAERLSTDALAGDLKLRDRFLEALSKQIQTQGADYVAVIQGLDQETVDMGTQWLQGIVDSALSTCISELTAFA
jgi:hypothetical protein